MKALGDAQNPTVAIPTDDPESWAAKLGQPTSISAVFIYFFVCQSRSTALNILTAEFTTFSENNPKHLNTFFPVTELFLNQREGDIREQTPRSPITPLSDPSQFTPWAAFPRDLRSELRHCCTRRKFLKASKKFIPALCKQSELLWRREKVDASPL